MEELLQRVSDETGVPVGLLDRAARARAAAAGKSPEAIAAEWAGAPVPEAAAESAAQEPAPAQPAAPPQAAAPAEREEPSLEVEVLEAGEGEEQPAPEPEPEPEPVATGPGLPGWLAAAFVFIPFIAVIYALAIPNGPDCGSAGKLAIDPVTGAAVNCDGSEFGAEEVNFFALGRQVFDASCAVCHGAAGGGGAGPALAGGSVLMTFSSCDDHIQWVTLGSNGWPDETYGDTNKTVGGGMPSFENTLSEQDLVSAVLYERVQFGLQDLAAAESACGLATSE